MRAEAGVFPFGINVGIGSVAMIAATAVAAALVPSADTSARHLTVFALAMGCGFLLRWIRHAVAGTATDEVLDESTKESHGG